MNDKSINSFFEHLGMIIAILFFHPLPLWLHKEKF